MDLGNIRGVGALSWWFISLWVLSSGGLIAHFPSYCLILSEFELRTVSELSCYKDCQSLWALWSWTPQSRFVSLQSDALKHNSTWGDNMPFPFSCHTARLCKNNISVFSLPPLLIDATRQLPAASTASDLPCEAWQIHFLYPQKQSLSCLEPLSQHVLPWQHHYPSLTSLYKSWRHIKSSIIRTRRLLRVTVPAFM